MTFDDIRPVDFDTPEQSYTVVRDRAKLANKVEDHLQAGKIARPFWTAAAGLIPFGLGSLVTAGSDALTDANIDKQNAKLNQYSAALGDDRTYNYSRLPSLDLQGLGSGIGSAVGIPQSFGDMKQPSTQDATGMNMQASFGGGTEGLYTSSTVTTPQTIDINNGGSWQGMWGGGGGVTGIRSYETAPSVMEDGGTIKGKSHAQGGVPVMMDGTHTGIEVEGGEKVINKSDWMEIMDLLDAGDPKKAKNLMNKIASREPKQEMATGGTINIPQDNRWQWDSITEQPYVNAPVIEPYNEDNIPYDLQNAVVAEQLATGDTTPIRDVVKQSKTAKDYLGYLNGIEDYARMGLGMAAASQNLPEYRLPKGWAEYMNRSQMNSEQGLTPEQRAILNDQNASDYAKAVNDITNYSGGNAGVVLGNLGVLNRNQYRANLDLANTDNAIERQNLATYGRDILNDVALQKSIFDIDYNEAMLTKQAGAGLAQDARSDIRNRRMFEETYGAGGAYQKAFDSLVQQGIDADVAEQAIKANPQLYTPSLFSGMQLPTVTTPNYNLTR